MKLKRVKCIYTKARRISAKSGGDICESAGRILFGDRLDTYGAALGFNCVHIMTAWGKPWAGNGKEIECRITIYNGYSLIDDINFPGNYEFLAKLFVRLDWYRKREQARDGRRKP